MNTPTIYQAEYIGRTVREAQCKVVRDGKEGWIPCRPMGWGGLCLMMRLKAAWMVFIGHADVLDWGPEQRKQ